MIIGISGLYVDSEGNRRVSGAGKDTVADVLHVLRHVPKVALADPFKRWAQDAFGFSYDQLWGPSAERNKPDPRYVRLRAGALGTGADTRPNPAEDVLLTPRFVLLLMGSEIGRACYEDVWIDYAIKTATRLMCDQTKAYLNRFGIVDKDAPPPIGFSSEEELGEEYDNEEAYRNELLQYPEHVDHVSFPDVRFFNEAKAIRATGGKVVRVLRKFNGVFEDAVHSTHRSENELSASEDDDFDYVIVNDGSLYDLQQKTLRMYDVLTGRILPFDETQENVPPFLRR